MNHHNDVSRFLLNKVFPSSDCSLECLLTLYLQVLICILSPVECLALPNTGDFARKNVPGAGESQEL